ncbi:MAG: 4Fe-4S dicluster domain-containing protein [Actinobacteria bacterium]|nr:4Fe-4S dicluster domain-containing protein [Actinomycetota bacterium]
MLYKILPRDSYQSFVENLIRNFDFIGPKRKDKATHEFTKITSFGELDLSYKKTTIPPAKQILFPSTEEIVEYRREDNSIEFRPVVEHSLKLLFGVHSCDINAINFLDKVFSTDFSDDNYLSKRRNMVIIGTDCEPRETCFCLAMGKEYVTAGFDLFLSELTNRYFVRVATSQGNKLIEKYASGISSAGEKDFKEYNEKIGDFRKKFKLSPDAKSFYDNFDLIYNDEEFWKKVAKNCFSCGSCCLVCPTCFCFNVRDEIELNLKEGKRIREWDSCMIPEYGLVAGGHNFRPTKENRLKQRYQCKLKTFVDKFNTYACVGCGRCIETCLANISIASDIDSVRKEVTV